MNYIGHPQADLEAAGGIWTAREISQQPLVWSTIEGLMSRETGALRAYLQPLLEQRNLRILGVLRDEHDPAGLSHWRAARWEALRAGRPPDNVEFLRCGP